MSDAPPPRAMGFYALTEKRMVKAAVFLRGDEGVTLEVLDERWESLARKYFTEGILSYRLGVIVTPAQPAEFMAALTEPRNMTYYAFRREQ
ncbi:hypothetical protein [Glycomyces buryatensis]|uniref:Uncharacterized protein n=1 Tax=Glycomyces buryatensis TaxID=2570927 RepID=A0A4S8QCJ4_9ACTN|nr:hypothetical protein [Glycomyces buryatensis]THV41301.1 hypothetical protein FAB82_12105 [Glycomyces buryatensis]